MDDIDAKIAEMEREIAELSKTIQQLAERLGAGENAVRAELNPAIRRERELSGALLDFKIAHGRYVPQPPVMYGPPWSFSKDN